MECDYHHPELCRKYINYGINGCKEGKNCPKFHPKLCSASVNTGSCPTIMNGERCNQGYHLRSNNPANRQNINLNDNQNMNNGMNNVFNGTNGNGINNNITTQDFLSVLIRRELGQIWKNMIPTQEQQPNVRKEQTGRDYLWALLGKGLQSNA